MLKLSINKGPFTNLCSQARIWPAGIGGYQLVWSVDGSY